MKVEWHPAALAAWYDLPIDTAEKVDAAILAFAAAATPGALRRHRHRVAGCSFVLSVSTTVYVTELYPAT